MIFLFFLTLSDGRGAWFIVPMTGSSKYDAKWPTNLASFSFLDCSINTVTLSCKTLEQNFLEISSYDKPWTERIFICRDVLVKLVLRLRPSTFTRKFSSDVSPRFLRSENKATFTFVWCCWLSINISKLHVQNITRNLLYVSLWLKYFIGVRFSVSTSRTSGTLNKAHPHTHAQNWPSFPTNMS